MSRSLPVLVAPVLLIVLAGAFPALAQNPQNPATPEKFVLSGVVVFDGGKGLAWLQEPTLTGNQVVALRPGETLGPYRLARILDDRVELEGPSGTVLVPVYGGGQGGAAGPVAVATARPSPPVASPSTVAPSAMSFRQLKEAERQMKDQMREARRGARQPVAAATGQNGAPDGSPKGRAGRRGQRNSGDGGSSAAASSGPRATGGMTISPGDPRLNALFKTQN
jgi:hypothetical protein